MSSEGSEPSATVAEHAVEPAVEQVLHADAGSGADAPWAPPLPAPPAASTVLPPPSVHRRVSGPGAMAPVVMAPVMSPIDLAGRPVRWAQFALLMTWVGVGIGLMMVAHSSTVTGLGTWWMGSPSNSAGLSGLLPFLAPAFAAVLSANASKVAVQVSIAAALVTAIIGAIDLGRVKGFAVAEMALGGVALLVSLCALAGREPAGDAPPATRGMPATPGSPVSSAPHVPPPSAPPGA